jgi:hypothetical protein
MDKFKEWIKDHKALAAVLGGLVLALAYYLYKKMTGTGSSTATTPASMSYSPGNGGGGSSGSADSTGGTDALAGLASLISAGQTASAQQQTDFMTGISSFISDLTSTLRTPTTSQPNVPSPTVEQAGLQPLAGAKMWQAPVTKVFGGSGGGMVYAENPDQITEFAGGGSKNKGGDYSIDFHDWQPAATGKGSSSYSQDQVSKVTGGNGTVESQLEGKTPSEKLSILKKAGLA